MTQDQKEILDVMDRDQWAAVVALANLVASRFAHRVLNTPIQDGARALLIAKAKHDGAQELITGLDRARAELTKRGKKDGSI